MGTHGITGGKQRSGNANKRANKSTSINLMTTHALRDWPVSYRLLSVIVLALVMGLVFGGLRVASAIGSASQFGRVSQLASLGQQITGLVQDLQNERDMTTGCVPGCSTATLNELKPLYAATDTVASQVQAGAAGVGGSFPSNIQVSASTVRNDLGHLNLVRGNAQVSQSPLAVVADYSIPISDLFALNAEIAQGAGDATLVSAVQSLNSLSLEKDETAQQRAYLLNSFNQQIFADGVQQALTTAQSEELANRLAFLSTATPAESAALNTDVSGQLVNQAEFIQEYINGIGVPDTTGIGIAKDQAAQVWYKAMSATVDTTQTVVQQVASDIAARAGSLRSSAVILAIFTGVLTVLVLLIVALATLLVARSLVLPLRRLRAGALDIATAGLPERVRKLGEAMDPAASLEVEPIDVMSADEIGQVARAFDQVHAEAVRLAGNEAMLRSSFNAMFVNLSRRSQLLIERLARMIDSLEQNEEDPDRLSNLFSMDHLVTRMRRNSENLLLLAGHESARKWSGAVPLADVARAATSEIEQYSRVVLNVQPGVNVSGQAVTDVVHLLAELVENATMFSPKDTQVHVTVQELTTGGVLIEISDRGVGISESRLEEMNWRLDNPPVMDVSVSRHMGLFAVGRLAQRHGVRVRLRPGAPNGLTALVWLPEDVIERGNGSYGDWGQQLNARVSVGAGVGSGFQPRQLPGRRGITAQSDAASGAASGASPGFGGSRNGGSESSVIPQQSTGAHSAPSRSTLFRDDASSGEPAFGGSGTSGSGTTDGYAPDSGGWSTPEGWAEAAKIAANPVHGDQTTAGLPQRVPKANLIPGSADGGRASGAGGSGGGFSPGGMTTGGHARGGQPDSYDRQPEAAPQRSPEMARSRLSGFQRGARRAQGSAPQGNGSQG
jgi:signal transduction histidine kinase